MQIVVREERPEDVPAIHKVNERAFGRIDEANIVDAVRDARAVVLSLVAEHADKLVGHILFSPVSIDLPSGTREVVGLAPMAVVPELQRKGIGSRLVREGLATLKAAEHKGVVVLGHPHYYPRFGFVPASRFGLRSAIDASGEAFMALELRDGSLDELRGGVAHYRPEFGAG